MRVSVCVCVCVRERERQSGRKEGALLNRAFCVKLNQCSFLRGGATSSPHLEPVLRQARQQMTSFDPDFAQCSLPPSEAQCEVDR